MPSSALPELTPRVAALGRESDKGISNLLLAVHNVTETQQEPQSERGEVYGASTAQCALLVGVTAALEMV